MPINKKTQASKTKAQPIKTRKLSDVGLDHSARNWRKVSEWFEDYDAKGEDVSFEFFMFGATFRKSNDPAYADNIVFTLGETADAPIEERYSTSLAMDDNRAPYIRFFEQPQHKETILGPLCFVQLPSLHGNRSSYIAIQDVESEEE